MSPMISYWQEIADELVGWCTGGGVLHVVPIGVTISHMGLIGVNVAWFAVCSVRRLMQDVEAEEERHGENQHKGCREF